MDSSNHIQRMIDLKQGSMPFYSTGPTVITDMDSFPYHRFYRGVHTSDVPIVMEREAGWRKQCQANYTPIIKRQDFYYPNHCFQTATSRFKSENH